MCFIFVFWLPESRTDIALGKGNTSLNSRPPTRHLFSKPGRIRVTITCLGYSRISDYKLRNEDEGSGFKVYGRINTQNVQIFNLE